MSPCGFLNCNKPAGLTSRDVVNIVQRRMRKVKVGHAGTLDPLAQGVLVVAIGPASRLVPYVQQQPKHYRTTFRLGASSVSGDLEGEVSEHPELPEPSRGAIDSAAASLIGTIEQTPPAHSAIWVDGQRAYKRIRAGEMFEMPKRTVEVYALKILRYEFPEIDMDVVCGSGTYIRSLGIDLAAACGSKAVMAHLCRYSVGPFVLADSVTVDQLRDRDLESLLMPSTKGVEQLCRLTIDETDSERLCHGLCIDGVAASADKHVEDGTEAAAITRTGELRAIVRRRRNQWCPHRVFATSS